MKNINGFSMVELLVTIAIILLISLIVFPSLFQINKQTREKAYDAKIKMVLTSAREWGNDNLNLLSEECYYKFVRDLINEEYLVGDAENKKVLKNPINNGSMNNLIVCIKYIYESDKYIVKAEMKDE